MSCSITALPLANPSPRLLANARHVVLHPEESFTPSIRALAWHVLASARGVHINLPRLTKLAEDAGQRADQ